MIEERLTATACDVGLVVQGVEAPERLNKLAAMSSEWVYRARVHFGTLDNTSADRKALERWCGEEIRKEHKDMRYKDVYCVVQMVCATYWLPREEDVVAAGMARSGVAQVMSTLAKPPSM